MKATAKAIFTESHMTTYYAIDSDVPLGTFTEDELLNLWKEGRLLPTDLYWAYGMKWWQPIREIDAILAWEENLSLHAKTVRESRRWMTLNERRHQSSHMESKFLRSKRPKKWIWTLSYLVLVALIGFWANSDSSEHGTERLLHAIALILLSTLGFIKYGSFIRQKPRGPSDLGRMISRSKDKLREQLTDDLNESFKIWGESASTHPISATKTVTIVSGYAEVFRLWRSSSEDYLAQLKWRAVFIEHEDIPLVIEEVGRVPCPRFRKS